MDAKLEKFVTILRENLGDNLVSIILYGSKAREIESGKKSDYNLLIIIRDFSFELLRKLDFKVIKHWVKSGNPIPHIFTEKEIQKSLHIFPMEFLDMAENRKVLFGRDLLENLKIDNRNLRNAVEYELKGKLLKLRQQWLLFASDEKVLKKILIVTISSFLSIFRHAAGLSGEKIPARKLDALEILKKLCGLNPEVFQVINKMKHGEKTVNKFRATDLMKDYMKELEKVVLYVDNL